MDEEEYLLMAYAVSKFRRFVWTSRLNVFVTTKSKLISNFGVGVGA